LVPSLYLKPFSRYLDLNSECSQTDGQKEKSITIYLAVHSVHLADIKIPPQRAVDFKLLFSVTNVK